MLATHVKLVADDPSAVELFRLSRLWRSAFRTSELTARSRLFVVRRGVALCLTYMHRASVYLGRLSSPVAPYDVGAPLLHLIRPITSLRPTVYFLPGWLGHLGHQLRGIWISCKAEMGSEVDHPVLRWCSEESGLCIGGNSLVGVVLVVYVCSTVAHCRRRTSYRDFSTSAEAHVPGGLPYHQLPRQHRGCMVELKRIL